jgi:hypothetical protein
VGSDVDVRHPPILDRSQRSVTGRLKLSCGDDELPEVRRSQNLGGPGQPRLEVFLIPQVEPGNALELKVLGGEA